MRACRLDVLPWIPGPLISVSEAHAHSRSEQTCTPCGKQVRGRDALHPSPVCGSPPSQTTATNSEGSQCDRLPRTTQEAALMPQLHGKVEGTCKSKWPSSPNRPIPAQCSQAQQSQRGARERTDRQGNAPGNPGIKDLVLAFVYGDMHLLTLP